MSTVFDANPYVNIQIIFPLDTIKHSMQTKRVSNPLNPLYTSLDGRPLANVVDPLIPADIIKKPLIKVIRTIVFPMPPIYRTYFFFLMLP